MEAKFFILFIMMIFSSASCQLIETFPQQYPFVVVLETQGMRCCGTLISHSSVLTASRCLVDTPKLNLTLGAYDLTYPRRFQPGRLQFEVNSSAFRIDPHGLIGIIRLIPLAMLNSYANIARIPFNSVNESFTNIDAVAVGFLRDPPQSYDIMHSIAVQTLNNTIPCATGQPNPNHFICLQAGAVCNLNIGSPMIISNGEEIELIGILVIPELECDERQPAGFLRITEFLRFIRANM